MFNKCALWIYISFCLPGWWTLTLIILRCPVVALFTTSIPSRSRGVYLSDWVLRRNYKSVRTRETDSCWKPLKIATTTRYLVTFYTFFYFIGLTGIFGIYRSSWRFLCRNSLSSLSLARSPCFFFRSVFLPLSRKISLSPLFSARFSDFVCDVFPVSTSNWKTDLS